MRAFVVFIGEFYIIYLMTAKVQIILRYLFIVLMLTTSIGKLLDNRGFAEVIGTYQLLPEFLHLGFGLAFSMFELALGIALIMAYRLRECGLALIGLHVMYTLLAVITLLRGLDIQNCGCFGVFWARPLTWGTVFQDVVLLLMSIVFFVLAPKKGTSYGQ